MSQKTFILILGLLFSLSAPLSAEPPAAPVPAQSPAPSVPAYSDYISLGSDLARKGHWNLSERTYMKAVQSPEAIERAQAYEGLAALYGKLKMPRKTASAKKRLEEEKRFMAKVLPQDESYYEVYTLLDGDTYAKIASRRKISLEWLKRANDHKRLITGKTIRVPKLSYSLVVNRNLKTLEWRRGDEIIKVYPVAVGKKESETPAGDFEIATKVKNPIWYHLKVQIPPESPKNLLGPRWLGLNVKGYGIHGTRNPRSINYAVSHGCVRMYNRDVQELFEWMSVGTKVTIRDAS